MPKENLIFKLDNLEYQYHYLNNTLDDFKPRLSSTNKLFHAKGKKTSKKISKLLSDATLDSISQQLDDLRQSFLEKKVYHLQKRLESYLEKALQQQYDALSKKAEQKENDKKNLKALEDIKSDFTFTKFSQLIAKSKIVRLVISKITPTKTLKENPPLWFESSDILHVYRDKEDECNPSNVWNKVVMKIEGCEKLLSVMMNSKKYKELIDSFDRGMDVFLGINREKKLQKKKVEANKKSSNARDDDSGEDFTDDEVSDREDDAELSTADEEALVQQYKGMLAGSDEEDDADGQQGYHLDPNVDYNEVTDEEPSDNESELEEEENLEEPPKKKQKNKAQLPELMAGYFSGGSDDEIEDDRTAKEQLTNEPKRKNRRGQRARQKIWEKKYGKNAKHVQRQHEKDKEEREKRQVEYEERVAKRAANSVRLAEESREKAQRLEERKKQQEEKRNDPIHPSWQAKKQAEERLKNVKFQGKKVTFD